MPGAQAGDEFFHAEIRQYSQGYYAQGRAALPLLNRYLPAQTRTRQHKTIDTGAAARLAQRTGATVIASEIDAPYIAGELPDLRAARAVIARSFSIKEVTP